MMSDDYGKSYALRLLIHYMGDFHQPVHQVSLVNKEHPEGFRLTGIPIPVKYPEFPTIYHLHATWDNTLYNLLEIEEPPFTDEVWANLGAKLQSLVDAYPVQPSDYMEFDLFSWAKQIFDEVSPVVVVGVEANQPLSDEYIKKNTPIIERYVVLAGHRLAQLIQTLFGGDTP